MATHETLTSLFSDIADAIRRADGTTDSIVADDFPDRIGKFSGATLNDKFNVSVPGINTVTLPTTFTPTCAYYYGGYYWVGGNDSAGLGYVAYSTDASNWTVTQIHASQQYPVHALAFQLDGGYVYTLGDSSGYGGRSHLRLNNFFSYSSGVFSAWSRDFDHTDAVTIDNSYWALTGGKVTVYSISVGGSSYVTHGSLNHAYYRCCAYNNYPIGISYDGYYTYKASITEYVVGGDFQIAEDFASRVVAQMGDYLVVAGTKDGSTYLYYAQGTPGSLTFTGRRVLSKEVTPIGLMFANGLYTMVYMDGDNLRFWGAESLDNNNNIGGIKVGELSGMTGVAAYANGNVMYLAANNNGSAVMANYTVP